MWLLCVSSTYVLIALLPKQKYRNTMQVLITSSKVCMLENCAIFSYNVLCHAHRDNIATAISFKYIACWTQCISTLPLNVIWLYSSQNADTETQGNKNFEVFIRWHSTVYKTIGEFNKRSWIYQTKIMHGEILPVNTQPLNYGHCGHILFKSLMCHHL